MSRTISLGHAWPLARLLAGCEANGEAEQLPADLRRLYDHLAAMDMHQRIHAWQTIQETHPDGEAIALAIASIDPHGPRPEPEGEQPDEGTDWQPIRFGTLPSVDPFPLDVLPCLARDLAAAAAESIGCPVDFPAVACLAVASGSIGRSVRLRIKSGYFASASLYVALVGGPSTGKSPALRAATSPLWEIAHDLRQDWELAKKAWEAMDPKERGEPPRLRRIATSDCTTEALGPILAANPRGMTVLPDEMTRWVMSMDQYKGGRGGDRPFYLAAWSGEPAFIDRVKHGNEPIAIPHPCLTIMGGMTPDMLSALPERFGRDDGFTARLLFSFPDSPRRHYSERGIPDEMARGWASLVRSLWAREMRLDKNGEQAHVIGMTPKARAAWVDLMNAHLAEHDSIDFDDGLEGCWGKMESYAGRLALILHLMHLASDPTQPAPDAPPDLDHTVIDATSHLIAYFKSHAKRTYAAMGGQADQGGSDVRAILRWIVRNKLHRVSVRDIVRNLRRFRDDEAALADALHWLVQRNIIRPWCSRQEKRGRRPSPAFDVNPQVHLSPRFQFLR